MGFFRHVFCVTGIYFIGPSAAEFTREQTNHLEKWGLVGCHTTSGSIRFLCSEQSAFLPFREVWSILLQITIIKRWKGKTHTLKEKAMLSMTGRKLHLYLPAILTWNKISQSKQFLQKEVIFSKEIHFHQFLLFKKTFKNNC